MADIVCPEGHHVTWVGDRIGGAIVLPDGAAVDVTPEFVVHPADQAGPLLCAIARHHVKSGALGELTHSCEHCPVE